uniref:Fibronectin type-III domain-containing protein n=1 Tax=Fervidobacterium nodosum TaxID=2424 RepID=A0A7C5U6X1_9BACT
MSFHGKVVLPKLSKLCLYFLLILLSLLIFTNATSNVPQITPKTPLHEATDVAFDKVVFSWSSSGVSKDYTYILRVGKTSNPPALVYDLKTTTFTLSGSLEENTKYYWQVAVVNKKGEIIYESPVWTFTTKKLKPEIKEGVLVWKFKLDDQATNSPAFDSKNNILYVTAGEKLYSIGIKDTNYILRWVLELNTSKDVKEKWLSSPVLSNDGKSIYVTDKFGTLYKISSDGKILSLNLPNVNVYSMPAVSKNDSLYFTTTNKFLVAYESNRIAWQQELNYGTFLSNPVINGKGNIVVTDSSGIVFVFEGKNQKWAFLLLKDEITGNPVIDSKDNIYVLTMSNGLYSFTYDGVFRWNYKIPNFTFITPVIGPKDIIYIGGSDGNLYSLNSEGIPSWKFKTNGPIVASPIVADSNDNNSNNNSIYLCSTDGTVYCLRADGTLKWKYNIGSPIYLSPVLSSNGLLIVIASDKNIYAIQTASKGLAKGAWPSFRGNFSNSGRRNDL